MRRFTSIGAMIVRSGNTNEPKVQRIIGRISKPIRPQPKFRSETPADSFGTFSLAHRARATQLIAAKANDNAI